MPDRIGLLLPRSTDYPTMGYEILEALRACYENSGMEAPQFFTENIGFGEDHALNFAKTEKLYLQDGADLVIAYCNSVNAETMYPLADAFQKPLLILDAGMLFPLEIVSEHCYHISLQGLQACRLAGQMAGTGNRKVLMATSFYEGGYRGPWSYDRGLAEAGGSVCGNYVSAYRVAEFTIDPYLGLLSQTGATSVAACFSSYLAELFFKALHEKNVSNPGLPLYCAPFMAEEQLLAKCDFPGGEFHTVVTWASSLKNEEQSRFKAALEKNKKATIFHLLGWEAGIVAMQILKQGVRSLGSFSYDSPRGKVHFHPETRYTYSPLYTGRIHAAADGKCELSITDKTEVSAEDHLKVMMDRPDFITSGWKNNYLCI